MLRRRYGTFIGGIDLADEKHATLGAAITPCPTPSHLLVPLRTADGRPARPLVAIGEKVARGQVIARPETPEPPEPVIYAPLDGTVSAWSRCAVATARGGFEESPAIELRHLSAVTLPGTAPPAFDWLFARPGLLRRRIAAGALTTCRLPLESLSAWLDKARHKGCRLLVANALESQPYLTCEHRLLCEHGTDVVRGLAILARALEVQEVAIVVDQRRTDAYGNLVATASAYDVARIALPYKYPAGSDVMLVNILTGQEVPAGGRALDAGVAVINATACLGLYRWLACFQPMLGRVVTVAGEQIPRPANFYAPYGTPLTELAPGVDGPLIHGGPMVGLTVDASSSVPAVVSSVSNGLLALEQAEPATPGPCIRCGWCTDHCPVRLNVSALNDAYELADLAAAERFGVIACIGCGVCSYVCPAHLPLTHRARRLAHSVRQAARNTSAGEALP